MNSFADKQQNLNNRTLNLLHSVADLDANIFSWSLKSLVKKIIFNDTDTPKVLLLLQAKVFANM